jgi:hypothetical protein
MIGPNAEELCRRNEDLFGSARALKHAAEFQKAIVDEEVCVWAEYLNGSLAAGVITEFGVFVDDADHWCGSLREQLIHEIDEDGP